MPDEFQSINAAYVAELYDRYVLDPTSIDSETRRVFDTWTPSTAEGPTGGLAAGLDLRVVVGAANLAECIRKYGHLAATLDPLGALPPGDPSLSPVAHHLTDDDLKRLPATLVEGPVAPQASNAYEAIERLRQIYCSTIGFDFAHVFVPEEREWLREAAESGRFRPTLEAMHADALLDRLTQVEAFERFLQRTFPGKTRFSIEGLDMLVPMLDEILCSASEDGVQHAMLGMAHRGRLNVLAHVLDKPYAQILAEFKDPVVAQPLRMDLGWTGDVTYHAGARTPGPCGRMFVTLAPNPSHLEAVDPVVEGMARAAGTHAARAGAPTFEGRLTLPILIHGDAAFPGQGVVAETLNLSRLTGYSTGGTIHLIANNQLGFTATPEESYSTSYASGLARGFKIPILHVNADDPVACLETARLACAYRARFGLDVLIDLVGYRRHGHNEGDEPAFTQPVLYQAVATHPTVRQRFAASVVGQGLVAAERPESLVRAHTVVLDHAYASLEPGRDLVPPLPRSPEPRSAERVETAVPIDRLRAINEALLERPSAFSVHKKLERGLERRRAAFEDPAAPTIDWATGEALAFGTILADAVPIRLTGQDVERGTFSHRHAVFHDVVTGERLVPLQAFGLARAAFEIHNSPLTESAAIGFELGYSIQDSRRLVVWEAQYGDFINGAQVVLDQFVTSGRAKWGLMPSLVFLLPHGYEGQGPEHSNARLERLLQAAADTNVRIVNATTPAQYFHVLRRQAALLERDPLPLFVLTPKSLLRHPAVRSCPLDLAEGRFMPVLDDPRAVRPTAIERVALCSGKVYVDMDTSPHRALETPTAIVRVEQLYPFPAHALGTVLARYAGVRDVVWVQEEPENMGAWDCVRPAVEAIIGGRAPVRYVGRARSASPSEGSAAWHQVNQQAIVDQAFGVGARASAVSHARSELG